MNSQLLLLKGDGGTGKTHLLCDFARKRVEAQLPTLLLMGQRFLSEDDPWVQLLQQLDLSQSSTEEFVGALESAAQASDCRALVMIDALNEGNGPKIWPAHLSSFLARLQESPWIGVVLSVRSSYEEAVIPENVRGKAAILTHDFLNDFARYVIGTESEPCWLSLRLDEEPWQSPEERTGALIRKLGGAERAAYEAFKKIENEPSLFLKMIRGAHSDGEHEPQALTREIEQQEERIEASRQGLMSTLTEDHRSEMESILQAKSGGPPRFDVRAIQRYVLWRVFDLGWTVERFGEFDRFSIGDHGRSANKPERMGKKYQWIAYHEILAHLSDHYQYREPSFDNDGDRQYEGPWQLHVRDIDPSCTLRSTPGGTSWGPHKLAWWGDAEYAAWANELSHQAWLELETDIPKIEDLLQVVCPDDGSHWVNVCGHFVWRQPHPIDVEPFEIERRQLGLQWDAYFVRTDDVDAFTDWVGSSAYSSSSLPEPSSIYLYYMFFGEYGWSPAFDHRFSGYYSDVGWVRSEGGGCPVEVRPSTVSYTSESGVFDCSVDEHYTLYLPHPELLDDLGLRWSGRAADYLDESCKLAAFDPAAHEDGPTALLISKELLAGCGKRGSL